MTDFTIVVERHAKTSLLKHTVESFWIHGTLVSRPLSSSLNWFFTYTSVPERVVKVFIIRQCPGVYVIWYRCICIRVSDFMDKCACVRACVRYGTRGQHEQW